MADAQKYSDEDVRAIIERALKAEGSGAAELDHADLLAVGEQVGVSAEAMTRAAEEVKAARLDEDAKQAITSRRRRWLGAHAAVFAVLNGLLYAVNAATTPGEWWVLFSVFFWGLALSLHAGVSFALPPSRGALDRERRRLTHSPRRRVEEKAKEKVRVPLDLAPPASDEAAALEAASGEARKLSSKS